MVERKERKPGYRITEDDGVSRLGAVNVGKYPLHHFSHEFNEEYTRTLPLFLRFAGYDEWVKGCYRVRKRSSTFAMELIREGTFRFVQNGREHVLEPGMLFLVHREADSEFSILSDYALKQTVSLDGIMLYSLLEQTGLLRADCVRLRDPAPFIRLFEAAHDALEQRDADYHLRGSALVYELLVRLGEQLHDALPDPLPAILNYINRNLSHPLRLEELCRTFGISRTSLHRLFVAHLHSPVGGYVIGQRLRAAQSLLQNSSYPIKEIAARIGYSSQLYFATEFKRLTGETPGDYRRRQKLSRTFEFNRARRNGGASPSAETDGEKTGFPL